MKRLYPQAPVVSVGAIIIKQNKVLLVKRGHQPSRDLWSIPGGVIELGETAQDALRREVKEECGIDVKIGQVFEIVSAISRDRKRRIVYHYVIIDFIANYKKGTLNAASDITDTSWFSRRDVLDLAMPPRAKQIVLKALSRRRRR